LDRLSKAPEAGGRVRLNRMGFLNLIFPPAGGATDEQVMWRVQQHDDHAAFAELVHRWETPIHRLCVRMTGDEHRGEDLAQEVFVRVFAKRQDFEQGRRFSTWLWRIALNLCHDELRRRHRRGEFPLEAPAEDEPALEACGPHPDEQLILSERADLVREALQNLPETHRAVVVLREYEGLKLREIAELLDIPEGTVKSRLADALDRMSRRLRPLLESEFHSPAQHAGTTEGKAWT
jgi:RNA polymerase sigma-70 factor (ECF subfamily)